MSKELKDPIVIIVIIILLFVLFYFIYKMLYSSKEKPIVSISSSSLSSVSSVSLVSSSSINNNKLDNNKIEAALNAFDIKILKKENFNEGIIFDSYDKVNKNVNYFLNTYLPIIDINNINKLLKENNSNDMQTVINNKKIDLLEYILDQGELNFIGWTIYSEDNITNIILFGLFIFYQLMLGFQELSRKQNNLTEFTKTTNMYYLNDYDEVNDVCIYNIPINYTGEISKKLNKDTTINELDISNIFKKSGENPIYKISLIKNFRTFINKEEFNILNILKGNTQSLKKMTDNNIAAKLIIENNDGNITVDTKIIGDIADFMIPSNFTDSFATFFELNKNIPRSTKLLEIVNEIKRNYNNKNNNTQFR